MHVQSKYAMTSAEARRVIAEHGWARVVTDGDGLRATYGFFLLEDGPGDEIVVAGHFARADPQCADIEARIPALLIFEGPHGFVSASWYRPELTDVPSTMNHLSVHLHGTPQPLDGEERFDVLRRTLERHETALGEDRWRLQGGGLERVGGSPRRPSPSGFAPTAWKRRPSCPRVCRARYASGSSSDSPILAPTKIVRWPRSCADCRWASLSRSDPSGAPLWGRPRGQALSNQWRSMPGSTGVPSIWTAWSASGSKPSRSRIVGAIWVVSTHGRYVPGCTAPGA